MINCGLRMENNLSVHNYEALWNKTSGNSGTVKLDVYGVFKPMNAVCMCEDLYSEVGQRVRHGRACECDVCA